MNGKLRLTDVVAFSQINPSAAPTYFEIKCASVIIERGQYSIQQYITVQRSNVVESMLNRTLRENPPFYFVVSPLKISFQTQ